MNQIILLLDIYRGTTTQDTIGTVKNDLLKLSINGLIEITNEDCDFKLTPKGTEKVVEVRQLFYDLRKDETNGKS